jgi:hypothetical protein
MQARRVNDYRLFVSVLIQLCTCTFNRSDTLGIRWLSRHPPSFYLINFIRKEPLTPGGVVGKRLERPQILISPVTTLWLCSYPHGFRHTATTSFQERVPDLPSLRRELLLS